ncbi:uracil-xanthine permease family protein [Novisyntrophococcus fermenticellae]|uniref:uracil-xanthine permease family protein n=1 Tax=Novisyntrophococcus fermenticellae TaxID=2068655 RepID=UPI001E497B0A|nr:nucleobase:cation symporter-2 family protein [Novisyntrophococcus fermenticellae]
MEKSMSDGNSQTLENKTSVSQNLIMGLQHVLTMCPGSIAVPLIMSGPLGLDAKTTAYLVAANLFTSAIAILIQVYGLGRHIGSRLPIVLGSAFAPLGAMIVIGRQYGLPTVFGAIIASGLLMFIVCFFMQRILKFFPPVVIGSFVTLIGITLAPTAFSDLAGGDGVSGFGDVKNLILGLVVLICIVLFNRFGNALIQSISLLLGLGIGTLIAVPLGMVDFTPVTEARWFELITPFHFGFPKFRLDATLIMTLFCVINMIQCIGVYAFLDDVRGTHTDDKAKVDGMRGQAFAQMVAGAFNSVPSSMFNENVGVIKLSGIGARSTVGCAGIMLLIISLIPKCSAFITCIPKPVIGGATLALFGTISAAGISILSSVDYSDNNNSLIVGTGLALGVGASFTSGAFEKLPVVLSMLFSNGLFVAGVVTIILNIVLNLGKQKVE